MMLMMFLCCAWRVHRRTALLARATKRLEWERVREKEVKDAEVEAERERAAYQAIDWWVGGGRGLWCAECGWGCGLS